MIDFSLNSLILIFCSILIGFIIAYWLFKDKITNLKILAASDDLDILNHRELKANLKSIIKNPSLNSFVFILIDIDRFNKFNDNYGYDKADSILHQFVTVTKSFMRKSDMFYRYKSGDEFVLIFPNTGINEAQEIGNRLRRVVSYHPFELNDKQVNLTVSLGITGYYKDDTPEKIRKRAEQALYEAKQTKNTIVLMEE